LTGLTKVNSPLCSVLLHALAEVQFAEGTLFARVAVAAM
jgi:hypothetical protein